MDNQEQKTKNKEQYSISPSGETFKLPTKEDYAIEMQRLTALTNEARAKGQEIVVVMGAGFVGAVMAAVVASTVNKEPRTTNNEHLSEALGNQEPRTTNNEHLSEALGNQEQRTKNNEQTEFINEHLSEALSTSGNKEQRTKNTEHPKFVIVCQRPSVRSYWKIPLIGRGESPIKAEDPEVDRLIARCVKEDKTMVATYNSDCLALADCVVVDVQCDFVKQELGNMRSGDAEMAALEATIRTIGQKVQPHCLTLIETTVAPGTTEFVAWSIMKKAFAARGIQSEPLLAHSFERVMPGRDYVASIRDFWRVCSGCNAEARQRVEKFLREVLNTEKFPLTVMDRPIESETTKIVENSYRATILAFLNEWSLFAERNGVDLIKVVNAIKMRPTHSNIIFPGPGVGGYCLPKDGGLGYWAYRHILGFEDGDDLFRITPTAIDTNDTRALHVAELVRDALRNMGRYIAGSDVVLCGASYRQDVGDTRYSGSEMVIRKLAEMGAEIRVHDPYVEHWYEFESQDTYPAPGQSWARYFRNQEHLQNLRVEKDLPATLKGAEALILAVPHKDYLNLNPAQIVEWAGKPLAIIDCFGILSDDNIREYFRLGCEVKALGRGHVQRLKKECQKERRKNRE